MLAAACALYVFAAAAGSARAGQCRCRQRTHPFALQQLAVHSQMLPACAGVRHIDQGAWCGVRRLCVRPCCCTAVDCGCQRMRLSGCVLPQSVLLCWCGNACCVQCACAEASALCCPARRESRAACNGSDAQQMQLELTIKDRSQYATCQSGADRKSCGTAACGACIHTKI